MSEIQLNSNSVSLGDWVDELFKKIFFQPDDALSKEVFTEYIAPDLLVRYNHSRFTYDQFLDAITQGRMKDSMSIQSNDEIQAWDAPDGSGAGCVAHMSLFTLTDKQTNQAVKSSSLILANVQVRDGKRVLAELTEIAK
ncbi:hypothetical protein CkaCkLH20_06696 [Colletotrichum karsti]|uniref:Uncharacterized protein n=1 Tax=Colletotrichum karsti TaxID=1095194 RepID=A0A9P6I3W5_9PEZI|nr:uncharacterized protein CkaCkLH20_06696 [Colletotrichum karsti]KAF9875764.1 hypothetical protein CkaCkLH20_06696 [Colletotrichum karsti]